jgi:hypothetical protein
MENSSPTKTLLGFMMKGVAGSNRDIVCRDVVCISTDGDSANRKLYAKELCGGKFVAHPLSC